MTEIFTAPLSLRPRPFTPPGYDRLPVPPVLWTRPAGLIELGEFEIELELLDARHWPEERLLHLARDGVLAHRESLPDAEAALSALDRRLGGEQLDETAALLLADIEGPLARAHRPYGRARRQTLAWLTHRHRLAARWFTTGWDNVLDADGDPVVFRADASGQVTDEALLALPRPLLLWAGLRAIELMTPDGRAEKNSSAPSTSGAPLAPSVAGAPGPASQNGAPARTSGTKTRRSPSPPPRSKSSTSGLKPARTR